MINCLQFCSNFAFKLNMRCYTMADIGADLLEQYKFAAEANSAVAAAAAAAAQEAGDTIKAGAYTRPLFGST